MFRRIMSLFLSVMMVISTVPVQVFAAETEHTDMTVETVETVEETTLAAEETEVPETTEPVPETKAAEETEAAQTEAFVEEYIPGESQEAANAVIASGTCGDTVTWTLSDDGVFTVSGEGAMSGPYGPGAPWSGYESDITTVIVESGVTEILQQAFYHCENLTAVELPEGLISIGKTAFDSCVNLKEIVLPGTLTTIDSWAFYNCDSLETVTIPASVTGIGTQAFAACAGLTGIWVEEENPSYASDGAGVLYNKDKTTLIQAPGAIEGSYICADTTEVIGCEAFEYCNGLTAVILPEMLEEIGYDAFGYTALTEVTIPGTVKKIDSQAFHNCTQLTHIVFSGDAPAFQDNVFYNVMATASYPAGNETWTEDMRQAYGGNITWEACEHTHAFDSERETCSCGTLGGICGESMIWFLSEDGAVLTVSGQGDMADYSGSGEQPWADNAAAIQTVILEEGVTAIGAYAFADCAGLNAVEIPGTVTAIGEGAFSGCEGLEICYSGTAAQWCAMEQNVGKVICADGVLWDFGTCGENLTYMLLDSTLRISGDGEMADYASGGAPWYALREKITEVSLADGISCIGACAFEDCTGLTEMEISETVTAIGEDAFAGCGNLTVIYAGTANQWRKMGQKVTKTVCSDGVLWDFGTCGDNLVYMVLDDTLRIFPEEGMEGNGVMADYVSGGAPWYALREKIGKVSLAEGITSIGSYALEGCCSEMPAFTVPASVTTISSNAFSGWTALKHIYIPATVTTVEAASKVESPFYDCAEDLLIYCQATSKPSTWNTYWNYGTSGTVLSTTWNVTVEDFAYWSTLDRTQAEIVIPEGILQIPTKVLANRTTLEGITLPDTIVTINSNAFSGCTNLKHIYIPESVTTIRASSYTYSPFSGCAEDLEIYCHVDVRPRGWGSYWNHQAYGVVLTTTFGCDRVNYTYWSTLDKTAATVEIPEYITLIPVKAFYNRTTLTGVTIPDSVTVIHNNAFTGCSGLRHVYIPASVTTIVAASYSHAPFDGTDVKLYYEGKLSPGSGWGEYWDYGTSVVWGFTREEYGQWCDLDLSGPNVVIPEGVTSIPYQAFARHYDLVSVQIPETVTTIGEYAFAWCDSLTSVIIPEGVTTIDKCAFVCCYSLTSVMIPGTVTTIGESAFYRCSALTDIAIPEGVVSVEDYAFHYCEGLLTVSLPASLTELSDYAFEGCDNVIYYWVDDLSATFACDAFGALFNKDMTTLLRVPGGLMGVYDVPESVTVIGRNAFSGCDGLEEIVFNSGLREIQGYAFNGCTGMDSIRLPDGLEKIEAYAFGGSDLDWIFIPESVISIVGTAESGALGCNTDTSVFCGFDVPREEWEPYWDKNDGYQLSVFYGCTDAEMEYWDNLDKTASVIEIPEGILSIPNNAFADCTELTDVIIPGTVRGIGSGAFYKCTGLTRVHIPDSVVNIYDRYDEWYGEMGMPPFFGCSSELEIYSAAQEYDTYDWGHTWNCYDYDTLWEDGSGEENRLTVYYGYTRADMLLWPSVDRTAANVVLPDGIESIVTGAFQNSTTLKSITIPDGVKTIGYAAFYNCDALTSITIPATVTKISPEAFGGCDNLTITYEGTAEQWMAAVEGSPVKAACADGTVYSWGICGDTLTYYHLDSELIVSGSGEMWNECSWGGYYDRIAEVSLPEGISSIGNYAFNYCTKLTTVVIPEGVTRIGHSAFRDCTSLTDVTIPEGVTIIGDSVFNGCGSLTSVTIPESVTSIGICAFFGCRSLTDVTIPEGVTCIGDCAFNGCSSLTGVTIPEGVTDIGKYAFEGCYNLTRIEIPEGVTTIGEFAFSGCRSLNSVTIPGSVASIGRGTFGSCYSLTSVTILEGVTSVEAEAFSSCSALTSVTIPESVTSIGKSAFSSCCSLTSVTIPEGVTNIGDMAFYYCSILTSITLPESVTSIGESAFDGCIRLTDVTIPKHVTDIGRKAFYVCYDLTRIIFEGSAPAFGNDVFGSVTATAYYPMDDASWTEDVMQDYGGSITWKPMCAGSHTSMIIPAVAPTCITTGLTEGSQCSVCGMILIAQEELPTTDHTEVIDEAVDSTCVETGLTEGKHCSVCNEVLVAQQIVPVKDHTAGETIVENNVAPDCVNAGSYNNVVYCTVCHTQLGWETIVVEALGHTEVIDAAVAPTCTETGLTEGKHCSVCGEVLIAQTVIEAMGHTEVVDEAVAPTCTETGLTEGKRCSVCGGILIAQDEIPATGHSHTAEVTAPDCVNQGYTTYTCHCGDSYIGDYVDALGHTEVIDAAVAPTCTETGLTEGKHCSVCGEVLIAQTVVEALGHTEVVDAAVAPTCTETGLTEGKHCSVCGKVLVAQTVVDALGHTEVVDAAVEPTCIETGLTEGKHCSVCGEVLVAQTVVDALGHTEVVDAAVEPTCTETGLTEGKHCSVCGEVLVAQTVVDALGHTEVIDAAVTPTCTETGLTEGKHCSVCDEVLVAQTVVEALGHTEVIDAAVEPTCTETGLTEGKHCSVCGKVLIVQTVVEALGHTEVINEAVAPTCTETGLTEGKHCSVCDKVLVAQTVVEALGHTEVVDDAVAPTCTETGLTEGKHCSVCGEVLVAQTVIEALGHTEVVDAAVAPTCTETGLTEGKHCSVCDEVLVAQTVIEALGHTEVIDAAVEPTCTETGLTEGKHCSVCNEILVAQTVIGALGHTEVIDEAVAPTCTETGLTEGKHCSVCDEVLVAQTVIEALGHTEVVDAAVEPTCTETGLTEGKHCSVCGEVLVAQTVVDALGHTEVVDAAVEPTCIETGLTEGKHCSVCGEVLIVQTVVEALGHTEVIDEAVAPTCTETGLTEGKHCSVCGEVLVAQTVIEALGHTEVVDAAVAPTCTETGLTEGKHCSVCNEILVAQTVIEALGHTEVIDAAVAPTCTETGLTEGIHCSVCAEVIVAQAEIPAVGHGFAEGFCQNCGMKLAVNLSQEFITMQTTDRVTLFAEVSPADLAASIVWTVEEGTDIIALDAENPGTVLALREGTAYVKASLTVEDMVISARCRVDVTDIKAIENVQLSTTAMTAELYSKEYAVIEILLQRQNTADTMTASALAAMASEKAGVAVQAAEFVEPDAKAMFDLEPLDDRRIAVVPKDDAVASPTLVAGTYTSAVRICIGDKTYTTNPLTLTVKKTQPKLSAAVVEFNSFYSGQSQKITITGATAVNIVEDASKASAIPAWLKLEGGKLMLTENAPLKSVSGKVYVLVETEEWAVPVPVAVSVKNTYKEPGVKLSASAVTMTMLTEHSDGVELKLLCTNKNDTLEGLQVKDILVPEGYTVENFHVEDGTFTLKTEEGFQSGKIALRVRFRGTAVTKTLSLTVKTAPVTLKLASGSITLNRAVADSAAIQVITSPADYRIDAPVIRLTGTEQVNGKNTTVDKLDSGELSILFEDGCLRIGTTDQTPEAAAYKLYVSAGGSKEAVLTVKIISAVPTVTYKASGNMDLSFPEQAAVITPAFKNYSGDCQFQSMTAQNAAKEEVAYFQANQEGRQILVTCDEDTPVGAYTLNLGLILSDGSSVENTVKVTVKRTAVKLKLSASKVSLNKTLKDEATVSVTCTTKGYAFEEPFLVYDDTRLDVFYREGSLEISLLEDAEYGKTYPVSVSAYEGAPAVKLNVAVLKENVVVKSTIKATGTLDVIRDGTAITVVPTYTNVLNVDVDDQAVLKIYSSGDNYMAAIAELEANDGVFVIDSSVIRNSSVKYKAQLETDLYGNGEPVKSAMISLNVKMGSAKLTVCSSGTTLFAKDKNDRALIWFETTDTALNNVDAVEIKDAKYQALFEVVDYGNGVFAIGYKDNVVHESLVGAKESTAVTLTLNVFLEGNETTKANTSVKLTLTIVK